MGSDLAVRYALDHPERIRGVVGIAGHGLHRDREWSAADEAGTATDVAIDIDRVPEVHAALGDPAPDWTHQPGLWRHLADSTVSMRFVSAGDDIRPSWPLEQLANLVPDGAFHVVPDVPHDFWATDPTVWREASTRVCRELLRPSPTEDERTRAMPSRLVRHSSEPGQARVEAAHRDAPSRFGRTPLLSRHAHVDEFHHTAP